FHLQVTALKTEVQQLRGVAGEHARLLALLSLSDVQIVTLAGTEHAPKAGARLLWDTKHEEGTVISHDLPPLPPGKVYQLWFLTSGAPIPSGTFQPDSHRWGIIQAKLPLVEPTLLGQPYPWSQPEVFSSPLGTLSWRENFNHRTAVTFRCSICVENGCSVYHKKLRSIASNCTAFTVCL